MSRVWYTSDTHFRHPKVAGLRGFTKEEALPSGEVRVTGDTEYHDAVILANLRASVGKDDILFIAGDFALNWAGAEDTLRQIPGRKVLITGNHDPMFGGFRDAWKHQARWVGEGLFEAVLPFIRRRRGKQEFLVSHFPYEGDHTETVRHVQYRLRDEGMWLVHGHVHSKDKITGPRQVHVGIDAWDMFPVPEEDVTALMQGEP